MYKVCIVADTYMNTLQLFCDYKSFFSNAIEWSRTRMGEWRIFVLFFLSNWCPLWELVLYEDCILCI